MRLTEIAAQVSYAPETSLSTSITNSTMFITEGKKLGLFFFKGVFPQLTLIKCLYQLTLINVWGSQWSLEQESRVPCSSSLWSRWMEWWSSMYDAAPFRCYRTDKDIRVLCLRDQSLKGSCGYPLKHCLTILLILLHYCETYTVIMTSLYDIIHCMNFIFQDVQLRSGDHSVTKLVLNATMEVFVMRTQGNVFALQASWVQHVKWVSISHSQLVHCFLWYETPCVSMRFFTPSFR